MNPIWLDNGMSIEGLPPLMTALPGTGDERFRRAGELLRDSGHDLAFASFTFDRDEEGSLVVIPDDVRTASVANAVHSQAVATIDDGVMAWKTAFKRAMGEIDAGVVQKVVIARQETITTTATPEELVSALARRHQTGFVFGIENLVGASPELLLRVDRGRLTSQVLAGTTPLDGDPQNKRLVQEHAFAADSAIDALRPHLTDDVDVSRSVVTHGSVKHIATEINGELKPGTSVLDVMAELHPTAAIAGTPRNTAIQIIREVEERSRGRYAGPIGWFDREGNGVFAVALRCAYFADVVTLYAGGGLVGGSVEEDELEETELKLATILDALTQS